MNDKTVLGLTGAQWMCLLLIPTGIWILTRVRKVTAADLAAVAAGRTRMLVQKRLP